MASWMEMAIWHPPVSVRRKPSCFNIVLSCRCIPAGVFLHVACEWYVLIYGEVDYGSVCSGVITLIFSWVSYCHLGVVDILFGAEQLVRLFL
jgi:hypothetical protein